MIKIDKKLIIQVAVLLTVLFFLLQPFGMGGMPNIFSGLFSGDPDKGVNKTGIAVFNGTVRAYEPFLVLPADTDSSLLEELREYEGVRNVKVEAQGILVETESRDDVYLVASYLRQKGVSSLTNANVVIPQVIEVDFAEGREEVRTSFGIMTMATEPVVEAGSDVTISMMAIVRDGYLINYYSPSMLVEETTVLVDAEVKQLNYKLYTYEIPWESRNSLGNLSQHEADYDRKDLMIFDSPLSTGQVISKNQLSYVEYIDSTSAQLSPDFDNLTTLERDFLTINYTIPSSTLAIKTNETPDINFTADVLYSYDLELLETDYIFKDAVLTVEMDEEKEINSAITLNVSIMAIGSNVVSVGKISPS